VRRHVADLIVQPDDGIAPVVSAIQKAKTSIDVGIFRLDRSDVAKALRAAVARGVTVRTLIAHTNRGGDKRLRKLEQDLLKTGASVRRTDDDLRRYHNKIMIVDRTTLYVLGFNYTALDVNKSRSFGVVTRKRKLVKAAIRLFEADSLRRPYKPGPKAFVVSPLNSRERLAAFLRGARRQLLVYDPRLTDPAMIRILKERASAGVKVLILGKVGKRGASLKAEKFPGKRLHVRAIVRDRQQAFVGSQGLRKLELDGRREVGVIVKERAIVTRMAAVFQADWALTKAARKDIAKDETAGVVLETRPVKPETREAVAKVEVQEAKAEAKEARVEAQAEEAEAKAARVEAEKAEAAARDARVEAQQAEAKVEAKAQALAEA